MQEFIILILIVKENQIQDPGHAAADADIREIEDRKVDQGKIDEICHISGKSPVDQVSRSSADQKDQAGSHGKEGGFRQNPEIEKAGRGDKTGCEKQKNPLAVLENAKGRAPVFQIVKLQDSVDQDDIRSVL